MTPPSPAAAPDRRKLVPTLRSWWAGTITPTAYGLPSTRALGAGLIVLAVVFSVLVATSINGTSSGAFFALVNTGSDPALLFGSPNLIRTDEWNVQTVWAISQFQQGLPALSGTFPGGMDTTIPQDLPRVDWTVLFRPHLWAFMVMDVGHAQAWKWWLPVFGLAAGAYAFILSLLPRRPLTSMTLAVAFTASPFFAWWLLQTTLWPVAWGFCVLAASVWAVRTPSRRSGWMWAVIVGYLTVVTAMGIYVPFIVPVLIVVIAVAIGFAGQAAREHGWPTILRRSVRLLAAGVAAGAVLIVWLVTRWKTVSDFLSTAYPGERLEPTGRAAHLEGLAALLGSSFTNSLKHAGSFLDSNAPESATFFLPGLFLGVVVVWVAVRDVKDRKGLPWALLAGYSAMVILLAFVLVPGWDAVAHLFLLDRSTAGRVRIGLGFGSMVILILLLARVTRSWRPGWVVSAVGPTAFIASQVAIAAALHALAPEKLRAAGLWWIYVALGALVIWAAARGWRATAAGCLLAVSVMATYNINPLYVGVFDLRNTAASAAIQSVNIADRGAWVGLGDRLPTALLLESGVEAFNGFQGAPGADMWSLIDPDGEYDFEWNRLAGVSWVAAPGDPVVSNPYPDQIRVTFDACSSFAQEHVAYVLSDQTQVPDTTCLTQRASFGVASGALTIWEVVEPHE